MSVKTRTSAALSPCLTRKVVPLGRAHLVLVVFLLCQKVSLGDDHCFLLPPSAHILTLGDRLQQYCLTSSPQENVPKYILLCID
jgi:hypothetical protein